MKITLNGYYGFANYGDELFNLTSVLAARRWWSGHDIDLLGPPVAGIHAKFRVPSWFPQSAYTSPGFAGKASRMAFLADAMLWRDLILYAGGSTLSYASINKKFQRVAAGRTWTKFAAIGVSIGPFADDADMNEAARFLRRFTFISVRDRHSIALLEHMHVPITPMLARDLVGALPLLLPPATKAANDQPVLGVSLCNYESIVGGDVAQERRRNAALIDGITSFVQMERVPVRIFVLNTHPRWGDEALSRRLEARLHDIGARTEFISAEGNLLGCWHGLAACTAILSVRLHGANTAYLTDVPFSLIEYHRKCTDLLDDIAQPESLRLRADLQEPALVVETLERLFRREGQPGLQPKTYIDEAALNFTQVPWASAPETP